MNYNKVHFKSTEKIYEEIFKHIFRIDFELFFFKKTRKNSSSQILNVIPAPSTSEEKEEENEVVIYNRFISQHEIEEKRKLAEIKAILLQKKQIELNRLAVRQAAATTARQARGAATAENS